MSDERPVDRAFRNHDAFEASTSGYAATATPFEAVVTASERSGGWWFRVVVEVPTLRTVVTDQEVGDAVADGWFETLERRIEDAYDVTRSGGETDDPAVDRDQGAGEVRVELGFEAADPARGVDDAAAVVDYVEGTYVQGVIPGYEYGDPVHSLVRRAREAGGGRGDDDAPI